MNVSNVEIERAEPIAGSEKNMGDGLNDFLLGSQPDEVSQNEIRSRLMIGVAIAGKSSGRSIVCAGVGSSVDTGTIQSVCPVGETFGVAGRSQGFGVSSGQMEHPVNMQSPVVHPLQRPLIGEPFCQSYSTTHADYKNSLKRKRGKHGPEARISPLEESSIAKAIRTSHSRPEQPVFLPVVGMEFNSEKEAKDFYNLYSWEIGFGIRKGRNRVNDNNYTTRQDFVCSCEGQSPNPRAASFRTGCKAMLRLHRTGGHGWVISRIELEHNHHCSATYGQNKQWPSHSDIDPMMKDVVLKLRENNIPIGRVCSILGVHGPESALPIRKGSVRYLCARIAQDSIKDDILKTINILEDMKRNDVGMEVSFKLDDDGKIKSMLWCTGRNRADYAKFGDVVTFDTTYRTNLYNLPFGLFIGVNNHFQSIVFGGVLLTNEKTEDFEWAFSKFVDIMGGKKPETMLTDQCQAMAAAIKSTLKGTKHRWCRWHVLRKIKVKVGPIYSKKSNFKKEFNKLVTNETVVFRFERKWRQLMRKYKLENNQFMQRLFKYRTKWAKPYFMDVFCAGMTSTQRSESANHMIKQFIQRSAPMHMFVRKFNEFQKDHNDEEEEGYLTQQVRRKNRVGVLVERHAELIYTRRIYEKFYNELYCSGGYGIKGGITDGVFEVAHSAYDDNPDQVKYEICYDAGDKITCNCGLFDHMGLLCRHSLKVLVQLGVKEVPKNNIMARWMINRIESKNPIDSKSCTELPVASSDFLMKRALVSRVLQVATAPQPLPEQSFLQGMAAMDMAGVQSSLQGPSSVGPSLCASTDCVQAFTDLRIPSNIRCPDRPVKKGRICNSSLKSWKKAQKRKKMHSTDDEELNHGKTRLLADVMAL